MKNTKNIEKFVSFLQVKRYAKTTIKSYASYIKEASRYFDKDLIRVSNQEIYDFIEKSHFSESKQHQMINALKRYYRIVHDRYIKEKYTPRPRRSKHLPEILSNQEIEKIINSCSNLKHKAILFTIYAHGLRISEAVKLKIFDIDSDRMLLKVNAGKGNKDRLVPLNAQCLELLRKYYTAYRPSIYMFNGQKGFQYSASSIRQIFNRAVKKCHIYKKVTVHSLRHSYATHLLELGFDIKLISNILGHKRLKTTEIYTQVTLKAKKTIELPQFDIAV